MDRPHVLKVGGAHLRDPAFLDHLLTRLRSLAASAPVVLVHGGGCEVTALQQTLGLLPDIRDGLRATSPRDMEAVVMVLAGLVNKRLVSHFVHHDLRAIGITGVDGGLLKAPFHDRGQLGRVGGRPVVDPWLLECVLRPNAVVVVAPVSLGPDGAPVNVNADLAAEALAVALRAPALEFVTDVEAVRGSDGPVHRMTASAARALLQTDVVHGGMRPKLQAASGAVRSGVPLVRVGNLESLRAGRATEVRP